METSQLPPQTQITHQIVQQQSFEINTSEEARKQRQEESFKIMQQLNDNVDNNTHALTLASRIKNLEKDLLELKEKYASLPPIEELRELLKKPSKSEQEIQSQIRNALDIQANQAKQILTEIAEDICNLKIQVNNKVDQTNPSLHCEILQLQNKIKVLTFQIKPLIERISITEICIKKSQSNHNVTQEPHFTKLYLLSFLGLGVNFVLWLYVWYHMHK